MTQLTPKFSVTQLVSEWKDLLTLKHLREDLSAGVSVACIAFPLSLAIALASGAPPATGLITAAIASVVTSLFAGTPLGVSGPSAAMAVMTASSVREFGLESLGMIALSCGLFQVMAGALRLGRIIRLIPMTVVSGFMSGVGAVILIGQLPGSIGSNWPEEYHILAVFTRFGEFLAQVHFGSVLISGVALSIALLLPKVSPRFPSVLIAVSVATGLTSWLNIETPGVTSIPVMFSSDHLPLLESYQYLRVIRDGLLIALLSSMQALLSSSVVDTLTTSGPRHQPDRELLGQGLSNIVISFAGGIPSTGTVARSALNVQAGAKTRRATLLSGLFIFAIMIFIEPLLDKIPLAALSGVLISVGLRMLRTRHYKTIAKASWHDQSVFFVTFLGVVLVDPTLGTLIGIALALAVMAVRFASSQMTLYTFEKAGPSVISINGAITALSSLRLDSLQRELEKVNHKYGVIFDLSRTRSIDVSGGSRFLDLLLSLKQRRQKFVLSGVSSWVRSQLAPLKAKMDLAAYLSESEGDTYRILDNEALREGSNRLTYGVQRFRREVKSHYDELFHNLKESQKPHSLFITCCDSRVNPNLITTTDPGELFIVRNIGNVVPPYVMEKGSAEGAAVEFAIKVLQIKDIIICAHSGCGAMKEVLAKNIWNPDKNHSYPLVASWLDPLSELRNTVPEDISLKELTKQNALLQIENLKTYPLVQEKVSLGQLRFHAWYYDIGTGDVEEWVHDERQFKAIEYLPASDQTEE